MNYNEWFFPNELNSQNIVIKPDLVWASDLFEFTVFVKKRKVKVGVLFILDIATNQILELKTFCKSSHGGSIKSSLICKVFKALVKSRNIRHELIIHTDRGAEYASKEYKEFINNNKLLVGSMSDQARPKQNSVAERMVRTLKTQLLISTKDIEKVDSIKDLETFFQNKKEFYNYHRKLVKNRGFTPIESHNALINVQRDEPIKPIAFNRADDSNLIQIQAFRDEAFIQHKNRSPLDVLRNVENNGVRTQQSVQEMRGEMNERLQRIEQYLKPKDKGFRKHLPLRDPASNTIYQFLMDQPRQKRMRVVEWAAFRIAITLLGFTGLRVNEIRNITLEQIIVFRDKRVLQIYQGKQNKYRTILLAEEGYKVLCELNKEIDIVFQKRETLSGGVDRNTWISFINNKLSYSASLFNINLKSHSFRINFVTSLLRLAPVQDVSQLIGHQDVKSTMIYSRYNIDKKKAVTLLNQGLYKKKEI